MNAVLSAKKLVVSLVPPLQRLLTRQTELESAANALRADLETCRKALKACPEATASEVRTQCERWVARDIQRAA